jgi:dihydrofolate synthase / folylpolyglutamate synthase
MDYEQALEYLASLNTFGISLGLTRIEELLKRMGQPQRRYGTVHVTGTNGKGSTTAMLVAILQASGIKTGMYTSPHLINYQERITVNGAPVTEEEFAAALSVVSQFVLEMLADGWEHPTEFEILTAAAYYHFAITSVEYAVIEVGMGGLLDSTNVIVPQVAVITNVALDHMDRCGTTIREIASQKAGIIKRGVPVVTAATADALDVIRQTATEAEAPLYLQGRDFEATFVGYRERTQQLHFVAPQFAIFDTIEISLIGTYQLENCANAIMASLLLSKEELRITPATITAGLRQASWPGRSEIFNGRPLLLLDGAHNPAGARVLRNTLDKLFLGRPITFLFGILRDKDRKGIIDSLIDQRDTVVVVAPKSDRAAQPIEVAQEISAAQVETADTIADGLQRAKLLAGPEGIVCAAGSLYLIGAVRGIITTERE